MSVLLLAACAAPAVRDRDAAGSAVPQRTADLPVAHEDSFVNVRTGDISPLPASITSIPGAGAYAASPDGRMLLFWGRSQNPGGYQVFLARVDGSGVRQLTDDPTGASPVGWSPDGSKIAYIAGPGVRDEDHDVSLIVVDVASGQQREVYAGPDLVDAHFGADAGTILFTKGDSIADHYVDAPLTDAEAVATVPDLWSISTSTGRQALLLENRGGASFSPDGRTIAFGIGYDVTNGPHNPPSEHHGEIWLSSANGSHPRFLTNGATGADSPRWSPDGSRIMIAGEDGSGRDAVFIVDDAGRSQGLVVGFVADWLNDETVIVYGWRAPTPNS